MVRPLDSEIVRRSGLSDTGSRIGHFKAQLFSYAQHNQIHKEGVTTVATHDYGHRVSATGRHYRIAWSRARYHNDVLLNPPSDLIP